MIVASSSSAHEPPAGTQRGRQESLAGAVAGEQRRSLAGQTPHVRWVAQQGTWDDSDAVICAGDAAPASQDLLS